MQPRSLVQCSCKFHCLGDYLSVSSTQPHTPCSLCLLTTESKIVYPSTSCREHANCNNWQHNAACTVTGCRCMYSLTQHIERQYKKFVVCDVPRNATFRSNEQFNSRHVSSMRSVMVSYFVSFRGRLYATAESRSVFRCLDHYLGKLYATTEPRQHSLLIVPESSFVRQPS